MLSNDFQTFLLQNKTELEDKKQSIVSLQIGAENLDDAAIGLNQTKQTSTVFFSKEQLRFQKIVLFKLLKIGYLGK